MGVGGRKCQNNGLVTGAIFFLCPGSRASRKMPRSPRLTHNTPVIQATYTWAYLGVREDSLCQGRVSAAMLLPLTT